ncbi:hypothetical protein QQ045_016201 [Rhodiola kirilowii]
MRSSKAGIRLRSGCRHNSHLESHWFTKAREKEIQQNETSIQSTESVPDADKVKAEANAVDEATGKGENSKARLQGVLGSRQAILRREQAMAYQRSVVL